VWERVQAIESCGPAPLNATLSQAVFPYLEKVDPSEYVLRDIEAWEASYLRLVPEIMLAYHMTGKEVSLPCLAQSRHVVADFDRGGWSVAVFSDLAQYSGVRFSFAIAGMTLCAPEYMRRVKLFTSGDFWRHEGIEDSVPRSVLQIPMAFMGPVLQMERSFPPAFVRENVPYGWWGGVVCSSGAVPSRYVYMDAVKDYGLVELSPLTFDVDQFLSLMRAFFDLSPLKYGGMLLFRGPYTNWDDVQLVPVFMKALMWKMAHGDLVEGAPIVLLSDGRWAPLASTGLVAVESLGPVLANKTSLKCVNFGDAMSNNETMDLGVAGLVEWEIIADLWAMDRSPDGFGAGFN